MTLFRKTRRFKPLSSNQQSCCLPTVLPGKTHQFSTRNEAFGKLIVHSSGLQRHSGPRLESEAEMSHIGPVSPRGIELLVSNQTKAVHTRHL